MTETTATPLIDAIKANDDTAAHEVLRVNPGSSNQRGPSGESAVLMAMYYRQVGLAALIASYADMDLCDASAIGHVETVTRLLEGGATTDVRSFDGWTPLHLAAFFGNIDVARVLVDYGADLEAISKNSTANTPLCAALAGGGSLDFVRLLVDSGADVNARVEQGLRPLHLAASRGALDVIQLLLDAGADTDVAMDDGVTPAAMAASRGHVAAAELLK